MSRPYRQRVDPIVMLLYLPATIFLLSHQGNRLRSLSLLLPNTVCVAVCLATPTYMFNRFIIHHLIHYNLYATICPWSCFSKRRTKYENLSRFQFCQATVSETNIRWVRQPRCRFYLPTQFKVICVFARYWQHITSQELCCSLVSTLYQFRQKFIEFTNRKI